MGRVVWTDPAIDDLAAIMDYIARDSPRYALQVGERIYEAAGKLKLGARAAGWSRNSTSIIFAKF
jgi:plasmid stabilization system protein ParE